MQRLYYINKIINELIIKVIKFKENLYILIYLREIISLLRNSFNLDKIYSNFFRIDNKSEKF